MTILVVDCSQLAKKYNIVTHVKDILRDCSDVKSTNFPLLYSNTRPGPPKVKLTQLLKKSHKTIMCFVVRLHYAVHVMNELYGDEMKLDFETFPELEVVFRELEMELKTYHNTSDTKPIRRIALPGIHASDELIGETCVRIKTVANRLSNIVQELDGVVNHLSMLHPANISFAIAEVVRNTINEYYT